MGGHRVGEQGPNDDGYEEDGYDESQRAEILEVTRDGPSDGTILTDVSPDLGDDEEEPADELSLGDDEIGEEDEDVDLDEEDQDEDEVQADFDDDTIEGEDGDDDLDDGDRAALEP